MCSVSGLVATGRKSQALQTFTDGLWILVAQFPGMWPHVAYCRCRYSPKCHQKLGIFEMVIEFDGFLLLSFVHARRIGKIICRVQNFLSRETNRVALQWLEREKSLPQYWSNSQLRARPASGIFRISRKEDWLRAHRVHISIETSYE